MTPTPKLTLLERLLETQSVKKAQALARSKYGTAILATISFLESLLPLPIVTDPFLAAAIMADRKRAFQLFLVTTVSSVIGGFCAYLMALLFRDWLFAVLSPDLIQTLEGFVAEDMQDTFLLTIIGAVTPVPYTIIGWAVAITQGSPLAFVLGSIVGRSFRYGVVGWLTYKFGPLALAYAKKSILLSSVVIFIFTALYIWLKM